MTIIIMTFPHLHFDWRVKRLVMPSAQSSRRRRHRPFICERSKNARGMVGGGFCCRTECGLEKWVRKDKNARQHVFEAFLPLGKSENRSFRALICWTGLKCNMLLNILFYFLLFLGGLLLVAFFHIFTCCCERFLFPDSEGVNMGTGKEAGRKQIS